MIIVGLFLYAAWAGFVGVPWWFAVIGGMLFALYMLTSAIVQMRYEFGTSGLAMRSNRTLSLVPSFAVSLTLEWSVKFLTALFLGRGIAWLLA